MKKNRTFTAVCAVALLAAGNSLFFLARLSYPDPTDLHGCLAGTLLILIAALIAVMLRQRRLMRTYTLSQLTRDSIIGALPIRLLIANRAGEILFSSHEKTVAHLRDFFTPEELKTILDSIDTALARPDHWHTGTFFWKQNARTYTLVSKHIAPGLFNSDSAILVFSDITEAAQSQATLKAVLNAVGDAVIATDHKANVTFLNPAAEFLTGYSAAQAVGRPLVDVAYPSRVNGGTDEVNASLRNAALKENRVVRAYGDAELISRDGFRRTISECIAPIPGPVGDTVGVVIVMRDITTERLNEQSLLETCQRLNEASNWAKISYFSVLPGGETLSIAGYPLPFPHGKTIADWFRLIPAPQERQDLEKTFALALRGTTERITRTFTLTDLNGITRSFDLLLSSARDFEGRITCMGTLQDVTERHALARNYLEANTLLTALLDEIPCAVLMKKLIPGGEGTYCLWNKRAEKYFNIAAGEAIGKTARQLPIFKDNMAEIGVEEATLTPNHPELRYNTTADDRTYALVKKALHVEGDTYILILATNITGFIENEKRLQDALAAAQTAEKDKSFFLATMSHELRTPLNAVIGFSELLQGDDPMPPAEQAQTIRVINFAATTLLSLINNILDFSKIEAGRFSLSPEPLLLKPFLSDIVSLFTRRAANENLTLTVENDPDLPAALLADRQVLRQILINIVNNAIKFTREGGVHLETRWRAGSLIFTVTDTGIGISKENLARIFAPFEQLKTAGTRSFEGTGLGLVISNRLAQLMGGGITVESEGEGKGSRFTITLNNMTPVEPPKKGAAGETTLALTGSIRNKRLFILDDVPMNLSVLGAMLKRLGIAHTPFSTAQDAFQAIASGDCPDAILTDLWMPGCSGIELVERLRIHCPDRTPPVVIVTADTQYHPDPQAGIADVLYKPITLCDLHTLLQNLFSGEA